MANTTTAQDTDQVLYWATNMTSVANMSATINNSSLTTEAVLPVDEHSGLDLFAQAFLAPSAVIAIVIASCGIMFNILNIVVLLHPKMRNAVNLLLTMMAFCELMLLIFHIPYVTIFNLNHIKELPRFQTPNQKHAGYMLFYTSASVFLHMSSSWLLITTASFRFIFVKLPLQSAKLCTYRRAVIAGVCTIIACLIITIPSMMLNKVIEFPCSDYIDNSICAINEYIYEARAYNTYKFEKLPTLNFWLFAVFAKFIPAILLPIFTIFLIRVLLEANARKRRLQSDAAVRRPSLTQNNEHSQTARMLLAVVILFSIIEFPHGVLLVYVVVNEKLKVYGSLGEVIDLVTILAFSLNLVLYSAMSRQYRTLFVEIFSKRVSTKFQLRQFNAKYKKCSSNSSHHAHPATAAETCALSHAQDTLHTVVHHSDEGEEKTLMEGKQKLYMDDK